MLSPATAHPARLRNDLGLFVFAGQRYEEPVRVDVALVVSAVKMQSQEGVVGFQLFGQHLHSLDISLR